MRIVLSSPGVPMATALTCEEHPITGASKTLLSDALSVGWPELGISNTEMRKMFTRLANGGMELFTEVEKRCTPSRWQASSLLGGSVAICRKMHLAGDWSGGVKAGRVPCVGLPRSGRSQLAGVRPRQYRAGFQPVFRLRTRLLLFSRTGKLRCRESGRTGCGGRSPKDGAMLVGGTCSSPFCFGCQRANP